MGVSKRSKDRDGEIKKTKSDKPEFDAGVHESRGDDRVQGVGTEE